MLRKLLMLAGTVVIGLTLPFEVSRSGDGSYTMQSNDACADELCTTKPNSYCTPDGGPLGYTKLGSGD